MNRGPETLTRLIALFPHDDAAAAAHAVRSRLFTEGIAGAYSLPLCAPLGTATRPLKNAELKEMARIIRSQRADTPFEFDSPSVVDDPANLLGSPVFFILGCALRPCVALSASPDFTPCVQPALILSLIQKLDATNLNGPYPFPLFFRAAYLANLIVKPLSGGTSGLSFEWEVGRKVWLPK